MDTAFITIVQKLVSDHGKEVLFNAAKGKAFLADYTRGEYKKESRLLLQALEAGTAKVIDSTQELQICKQQQIRTLQDEYFLTEAMVADVVDMLAFVLRGDNSKSAVIPSGQLKIMHHSMNHEGLYNISFEFKETGPFTSQQLIQRIWDGQISRGYWICSNGSANWQPISNIIEFNNEFPDSQTSKYHSRIFKIGEKGPAGGIIFFDKHLYEDNWRYLEAAPEDLGPAYLGGSTYGLHGDCRAIGAGKHNTDVLFGRQMISNESGTATMLCRAYRLNGFDDWFLPSEDELSLLYKNIKTKKIGEFKKYIYWSSSYYYHGLNFNDGRKILNDLSRNSNKDDKFLIRAIRMF